MISIGMCVLGSIELGYFPMYKRHLNVLHMQRLTSLSLNHSYGFWDLTWFKKPTSPHLCWHIYHARNVPISNLLISLQVLCTDIYQVPVFCFLVHSLSTELYRTLSSRFYIVICDCLLCFIFIAFMLLWMIFTCITLI